MQIDIAKVNIRNIGPDDIPELVRHRIEYLIELQGQRDRSYIEKLSLELTNFFNTSLLNGSFIGLIAHINHRILAYGAILIKNVPGDMNSTKYREADIFNMYTMPDARKNGISKMILNGLIEKAKDLKIAKLALHTSADGEKIYRSFGFSEPGFPYLELVTGI